MAHDITEALPGLIIRKAMKHELIGALGVFLPDTFEILYNPRRSTWRSRVMTLAHELGHLKDLLKNYDGDPDAFFDEHEPVLERKAYLYGWEILLRSEIPIARGQWKFFHSTRITEIKKHYRLHSVYSARKAKGGYDD